MDKYKDEMSRLHFSEEGKINLMKKVKENTSQMKQFKVHKLSKIAIVAASLCFVSITAFATGIIPSVTQLFTPIFGESKVQTDIIEQIGRPIDASDTDQGITITAEAIMGSKNHAVIIYKLSNEDGSSITLPEGADTTFLMANSTGTEFNINGGSVGGMRSELYEDGYYRVIEVRSFDSELPNGEIVTTKFENLTYFDVDGKLTTLVEGNWNLKFEFSYDDMMTEIPVHQMFERQGLVFTVEQINLSPISIDVLYTVNTVPSFMDSTIESENMGNVEYDLYAEKIEVVILKTDGTLVDMTNASGGLTYQDTYVSGNKGSVLEEIIPIHEILSITVGDIEVFLE